MRGVVAPAEIAKYPSAWNKELICYRSPREEVTKTLLLPTHVIHLRSVTSHHHVREGGRGRDDHKSNGCQYWEKW